MQTREHSRSSRRHSLAVVVLTLVGAVAAVALSVAPASASPSSVVPAATTPLVPGILGVVIGLVIGLLVGLLTAERRRPAPVEVRPAATDDQVLAELRKLNERLSVLETPVASAAVAAQADPGTPPFAALPDDVAAAAPTPTPAAAPSPAPAPALAVEDDWTPPEPDAVPEWQPTLPDPEPPEPKDAVTVLEEWTGEDRFQTGSHPVLTDEVPASAPADLEETQRFVFPDPLTPEQPESAATDEPEDVPAPVLPVEPRVDNPEASPVVADATWEQPAAAETTPTEPDDVPDTHEVSDPITSSTGGWQGNAPRAGDLGGGDAIDEPAETPDSASRIADWRWGAETTAEDAPTEDPLSTPAWADVTAPVAEEPAEEPAGEPQPAAAVDEPVTSGVTETTTDEDDPLTAPTWADATTPAADEPTEDTQSAVESTETTAEDAPEEDPLTAPTWSAATPSATEGPTDEDSRIAEWHWGTEAESIPESPVPTATEESAEESAAESAPATWGDVSAPSDEPLVSQDDSVEPANDGPAPWWPTTGTPEAHASDDETAEPEAAEPAAEEVDVPTTEADLTTEDLTTDDTAVEETTSVTDGAATIDSLPEEAADGAGSSTVPDHVEDWRWTPDDTTATEPEAEPQQEVAPASATETASEKSPETQWADIAAPGTEPEIATDPVEGWRSTPDDTTTSAAAESVDETVPEAEDATPAAEPAAATTDQVEDWRWTPEEEVAEATRADDTDTAPASPAVASIAEPTAEMPTLTAPSDEGTDPEFPTITEAARDPLTAPLESLDTDPTEATPLEPPSPANRPPFGSWSAAPVDAAPEPITDDVAPQGLETDDEPEPAPPIWAAPHDDDHDETEEEEPDSRPLRSRISSMFDRTRSPEPAAEPEVASRPEAAAPPAPAYDPLSAEYVVPEEELGSTTPTYHDLEDTISSSVPLYVEPPAEQPVAPTTPPQAPPVDPAGGSLLDDFLADDEAGHAPPAAPGATEARSPDGNDPDDDPDRDDSPSMWRPSRWIGN